jgi:hypothetical protein
MSGAADSTRREFAGLLPAAAALAAGSQKKVAAIVTEYRYWSHADVIVGRLLGGYSPNGVHKPPRTRVVSMFTHQIAKQDMSRDLAARHGFRIYPTIEQALTLGTGKLAVDAVCFVGEHGDYPLNDVGQKMYPRFELFSQILDVIEKNGRPVPCFFDKHLSYSWEKAFKIWSRVQELKIPFLCGSSVTVTPRTPPLEIEVDSPVEHAVVIGHGDFDSYGFHLLETAQCMLERRKGGESGVARVEWIEGEDAIGRWKSGEGSWSAPVLQAAMASAPAPARTTRRPVLFSVNYRDGVKLAAFMLEGNNRTFAARVKGNDRILTTRFGPDKPNRPLPHFDGFVYCIEELFLTGKALNPPERTVLTTGILAYLFESRRIGKALETPLDIRYRAPRKAWVQTS